MRDSKLKSVEEVVAGLRVRGDLDEEKWRELKRHWKKLYSWIYSISAFLLVLALIKMELLGLLLVGGLVYYLVVVMLEGTLKEWTILTHLFSNGVRHGAVAKEVTALFPYGVRQPVVDTLKGIECSNSRACMLEVKSILNLNKEKFTSTYYIPSKWVKGAYCPKSGDEIDVVYDKDNPSLFRFYNKKLDDFYCINKNKKGEISDGE